MLVIFDLDGTLLDTVGDIGGAADNVLGFHCFPKHSAEEYMAMMGHGMRNFMKNFQIIWKRLFLQELVKIVLTAKFH